MRHIVSYIAGILLCITMFTIFPLVASIGISYVIGYFGVLGMFEYSSPGHWSNWFPYGVFVFTFMESGWMFLVPLGAIAGFFFTKTLIEIRADRQQKL